MTCRQHLLSEPVPGAIRVSPNCAKRFLDAQSRRSAKIVGQVKQLRPVGIRGAGLHQSFRMQASRSDCEQFGADVDEPAEQQLLALELWAMTKHGVEQRSRQSPARPRDVTEMLN